MDSAQITESKKRTRTQIQAQELAVKIRSKADMIDYLDKHRKSHQLPILTPI